MRPNVLLMPEGDGGGGGTGVVDFNTAFDVTKMAGEEFRTEASLGQIKTIGDLAKGYVSAQRMVGAEKLLKPQPNWTEQQWGDFYKSVGRPETHEKYTFDHKTVQGLPEGMNIDEAKLMETKKFLHQKGLTDKQASDVLKFYLETTGAQMKSLQESDNTRQAASMTELRKEFGNDFEGKVNIAKAVVQKFGTPELVEEVLNKTKLGDNPAFIRMFAKIGEAMMDDTARGQGAGLLVTDANKALSEIKQKKGDTEFQKALGDRGHPGHKEALETWENLHRTAYPNK